MSELEIFLWLTQAPNTSMQISRNIGATMTDSRQLAHDKVLIVFSQKWLLKKTLHYNQKNIITLIIYIDINELVYEKRLMMKVFSMTKFCVKKPSFAKTAASSLKMSKLEIFLWFTQAPNTSMQISRNIGATKKASRKMVQDSYFKNFLAKRPFVTPKWWHHQNKW